MARYKRPEIKVGDWLRVNKDIDVLLKVIQIKPEKDYPVQVEMLFEDWDESGIVTGQWIITRSWINYSTVDYILSEPTEEEAERWATTRLLE